MGRLEENQFGGLEEPAFTRIAWRARVGLVLSMGRQSRSSRRRRRREGQRLLGPPEQLLLLPRLRSGAQLKLFQKHGVEVELVRATGIQFRQNTCYSGSADSAPFAIEHPGVASPPGKGPGRQSCWMVNAERPPFSVIARPTRCRRPMPQSPLSADGSRTFKGETRSPISGHARRPTGRDAALPAAARPGLGAFRRKDVTIVPVGAIPPPARRPGKNGVIDAKHAGPSRPRTAAHARPGKIAKHILKYRGRAKDPELVQGSCL